MNGFKEIKLQKVFYFETFPLFVICLLCETLVLNIVHVYISMFVLRKAKDSSGQDVWLTNSTYWELRKNPGFANLDNVTLW